MIKEMTIIAIMLVYGYTFKKVYEWIKDTVIYEYIKLQVEMREYESDEEWLNHIDLVCYTPASCELAFGKHKRCKVCDVFIHVGETVVVDGDDLIHGSCADK